MSADVPRFSVGQRVIVKENSPSDRHVLEALPHNQIGYFGHVERIDVIDESAPLLQNLYWIRLLGRTGEDPAPWMLEEPWFNPFAFWEYQLEAAD
jgi:hypothetical protein